MVKAHFKGMKTQLLLVLGDDNTHKYRCYIQFLPRGPPKSDMVRVRVS